MAPKKKQIQEALKELAIAHMQLIQARENHLSKDDASEIVLNIYDQDIRKIEVEITAAAKELINQGG